MPANPLSEEQYKSRIRPRNYGVRGDYFRDQTAIIHSRPFRRLKHKTQVFFAPENDHVCTRMEHVLHVATIAAVICKGLNLRGWELDPELATAIGFGHDIGHAPFGHAGEAALSNKLVADARFMHELNGLRVVQHLFNYGKGLNLTYGVRDGIVCHNGESFERSLTPETTAKDLDAISDRSHFPNSYEGCIVRLADKIGYLGRDIEDAIIAKLISLEDVPREIQTELGSKNGEIIDTLVEDVIAASAKENTVCFSVERHALMLNLKKFNYEKIYRHPRIQRYIEQCDRVISTLFDYLVALRTDFECDWPRYENSDCPLDNHFGRFANCLNDVYEGASVETLVVDFIAGMTDGFALKSMHQISIPEPIEFLPHTGR